MFLYRYRFISRLTDSTAFGLISVAITEAKPARSSKKARIPEPVPISIEESFAPLY